jgi:hypothetical protein
MFFNLSVCLFRDENAAADDDCDEKERENGAKMCKKE